MAHLGSTYSSFETFLNGADGIWTVDLDALNSSGANASAVLAMNTEEDGTNYLNVAITATGMTPSQVHAQHVHGLFDEEGNPIDSISPTLADDADKDGMVEVLEGVSKYGDVLLPLSMSSGDMPMADENGVLSFIQNYDLGDDSNFFSPVTMTDYTGDDVMPLDLREVVLHGVQVPDGIGEGTGNEVDGGENGYTGILPAAAGEIESATLEEALAVLGLQRDVVSERTTLTEGDDSFDAGRGDDFVEGLGGDDSLLGGSENDTLVGNSGRDALYGGADDDLVDAGDDDDNHEDAADMGASGSLTLADYDNGLAGGAGDDTIEGGVGDDIITGDDDSRVSEAVGAMFDAEADGSDMIYGGAGNDEIHTGSWSDSDQDLPNAQTGMMSDFASGGAGDDILRGAGGDDTLYGDMGADNIGGGGGADMIYGDFMTSGSTETETGQLVRLYQAAFDRAPDTPGLKTWVEALDGGDVNLKGVALGFTGSAEFAATFGGTGNTEYVQELYQNVLDREADSGGLANWTTQLENGATRADVLIGFSQSQEFIRNTDQAITDWVTGEGTDDVLAGNGGDNMLSGGVMSDSFVFSTDAGSSHTVTDLESWDMLDFSAFGYDDADAAIDMMSQSGDDLVFSDQDVTVTLQNTAMADVDPDMIMV